MFGHQGMYCGPGWWDCAKENAKTRVGIPVDGVLRLVTMSGILVSWDLKSPSFSGS